MSSIQFISSFDEGSKEKCSKSLAINKETYSTMEKLFPNDNNKNQKINYNETLRLNLAKSNEYLNTSFDKCKKNSLNSFIHINDSQNSIQLSLENEGNNKM